MAKILIIEDDPDSRNLTVLLLRHSGHSLEWSKDGEGALKKLRDNPADVILCDLQLPGMTGLELVRQLRSQQDFQDIPVIAVSAEVTSRTRDDATQVGFTGFIEKPIDPRTFAGQVESFLHGF